jgi:very-short-patch-repair endonuclease
VDNRGRLAAVSGTIPGMPDDAWDEPLREHAPKLWRRWWREQARLHRTTPLERLALSQGFVVTTNQAHAHGFERHDRRRELRRGHWWSPARGALSPIVIDGDDHDAARRRHALQTAAKLLLRPDHLAGARSAAILHGLPTMRVPDQPEIVTLDEETTGRRRHAHVRGGAVPEGMVGDWYGVPVLSPARAVVDVARFDRWDGLMAADAGLGARLITSRQVIAALPSVTGWPGVRRARRVLELASPKAESPLESIVRLRMHDDGFPRPELQVHIRTRHGTYRVDMLFAGQRLIVEIDGLGKYTDAEVRRERLREARLRAAGYRVERVTWEDAVRCWPQTRLRLLRALAA